MAKIKSVPAKQRSVVTVGVFDGVHSGHISLIRSARKVADQLNAALIVASFDPHPTSVLRPESFLGLLTTSQRRAELLLDIGVDRVEFVKFDDQLRHFSPDEFVESILLNQLGADAVVVGSNFRFGYQAAGDVETLKTIGLKYGVEIHIVELLGDIKPWSSTRIRQAILAGEVAQARHMLGRPHRLSGVVVHGDHRGRELGYPTANLDVEDHLIIPADGVYSALALFNGRSLAAAVSIGTNPTFEGVLGRRVEAYVLDHVDLDLYGQQFDLDFVEFVRPTLKFDGIDALLAAMAIDVVTVRSHISDFVEATAH